MKYTINSIEAKAILENATSTTIEKARASFVIETIGQSADYVKDYALSFNKKSMEASKKSVIVGDSILWNAFIEGVEYIYIDFEAVDDTEAVKVRNLEAKDVFCKKATKNSTKKELPLILLGMLNQYGHNLGVDFLKGKDGISVKLKEKAVAELKLYTKYTDTPKVFFDNANSNKGHERQLQVFFDTFYGEGVVVATKHYVDHLKEAFIVATKEGYKDKSEIAFLQLIMNEAYMASHGKKYTFKSNLTCHKEVKEKETK